MPTERKLGSLKSALAGNCWRSLKIRDDPGGWPIPSSVKCTHAHTRAQTLVCVRAHARHTLVRTRTRTYARMGRSLYGTTIELSENKTIHQTNKQKARPSDRNSKHVCVGVRACAMCARECAHKQTNKERAHPQDNTKANKQTNKQTKNKQPNEGRKASQSTDPRGSLARAPSQAGGPSVPIG